MIGAISVLGLAALWYSGAGGFLLTLRPLPHTPISVWEVKEVNKGKGNVIIELCNSDTDWKKSAADVWEEIRSERTVYLVRRGKAVKLLVALEDKDSGRRWVQTWMQPNAPDLADLPPCS